MRITRKTVSCPCVLKFCLLCLYSHLRLWFAYQVMDVWRKERSYVQQQVTNPVSPTSRASNSSEDLLSGGILEPGSEEENQPGFYSERALVHRLWLQELKHLQVAPADRPSSPSQLVTWRPNSHSNTCVVCSSAFGMWRRKHHCRRCGELVCGTCSPGTGPGLTLVDAPEEVVVQVSRKVQQRICTTCEKKLASAPST